MVYFWNGSKGEGDKRLALPPPPRYIIYLFFIGKLKINVAKIRLDFVI